MTGRGTDRSPTADTWRIYLRVGVGVGEGKIEERFSGFVILCRCRRRRRRQRRPWQQIFFSHTPKTVGDGVGDHPSHFMIILFLLVGRSPTKKPMKIGKKIKIEKIFGYLVGRSVGRSAANLVLSSSSYCFCWLVGRRWKEKKDEKRLKKNRKICGRSFGRRSAVFGEGGRKAKR